MCFRNWEPQKNPWRFRMFSSVWRFWTFLFINLTFFHLQMDFWGIKMDYSELMQEKYLLRCTTYHPDQKPIVGTRQLKTWQNIITFHCIKRREKKEMNDRVMFCPFQWRTSAWNIVISMVIVSALSFYHCLGFKAGHAILYLKSTLIFKNPREPLSET